MLAARDQENLVHGQQAAAASKPLNQGVRQLAPKTPANRPPKTPFKLPLNDENGAAGFGGGKLGLNTVGRGNENIMMTTKKAGLGDKNAFVTPMGPRTRAPLGAKTTNAKAKAFQTPLPALLSNDMDKQTQKSATTRKAKPRVSHAEMTKLEILGDNEILGSKDDLEERKIEYMPPPVKNLPDIPDDFSQSLDLSMFENGGLTRGYMQHFLNKPDAEGLSYYDRKDQEEQKRSEQLDKMYEAMSTRAFESADIPCLHYPECASEECKDIPEIRRKAEEKFQRAMAEIEGKPLAPKPDLKAKAPRTTVAARAPSSSLSRHAASALSQGNPSTTKPTTKIAAAPKSRLHSSLLPSSRKKTPPPTNPSPMRHTAAAAASKQTMGYSKGRATSATLRKTVLPATASTKAPVYKDSHTKLAPTEPASTNPAPATQNEEPDTSLSPGLYIQRYGVPRMGSEMWHHCQRSGCFDEDDKEEEREREDGRLKLERMWMEEAEEEFVFGV
ncbi:hypothetical protein MMC30_008296 [Trapelia coarctata]|nr:hypothetical protein [Trapelia coarctata]